MIALFDKKIKCVSCRTKHSRDQMWQINVKAVDGDTILHLCDSCGQTLDNIRKYIRDDDDQAEEKQIIDE